LQLNEPDDDAFGDLLRPPVVQCLPPAVPGLAKPAGISTLRYRDICNNRANSLVLQWHGFGGLRALDGACSQAGNDCRCAVIVNSSTGR